MTNEVHDTHFDASCVFFYLKDRESFTDNILSHETVDLMLKILIL